MVDTSARLLRLLSLLQRQPDWSGPELARHLEVTVRTVRRDVERLRQLGYPVDAATGVRGGYRLGVGTELPPLLLDEDEATAVAVALGALTDGAVRGVEEPALAALAKIDRLLPPALRSRVGALRSTTEHLPRSADDVDATVLVTLSQASAACERLLLAYTDRNGNPTERRIEPYKLVATGRRWYLVARDVERADWRTFRADRIGAARRTGHRFERHDPPDAAAFVNAAISVRPYRHTVVAALDAPVDVVARRVPPTVAVVEPDGDDASLLTTGGDDLDAIAGHLVALAIPFAVREPAELRARLRTLGERLVADHP